MTDDILEAEEVAKMLRVHPRTIIRLASQGEIPGFKVGGQWRFRREAIDKYIQEQEQRHSGQKSFLPDSSSTAKDEDHQNKEDKS